MGKEMGSFFILRKNYLNISLKQGG